MDLLQIINERILAYGGIEETARLIEEEMNSYYQQPEQRKPKFILPSTKYEALKKREFLKIINS